MKSFTYFDYIKCIHTLRLNAVLQLAEEGVSYKLEKNKQNKEQDNLLKDILKSEKEMAKFINDFLEPNENIESKNLITYTNNYITKKYKSKEADLIYYLKNQDVFFLVEHQSKVDDKMPYKILNICIDIIQEWSRARSLRQEMKYPIVVPIIIYTGCEKWKIPKDYDRRQISNYVLEKNKIDLEYNLIELNRLSKKYLLQKKSIFSYGAILEKSRNTEELKENINIILNDIKNKGQLEEFRDVVIKSFKCSLDKTLQGQILRKIDIKIKKGENDINILYESMERKFRQNIIEKIQEEKLDTAKKLLERRIKDNVILESTQITTQQLEEIKKEMLLESK